MLTHDRQGWDKPYSQEADTAWAIIYRLENEDGYGPYEVHAPVAEETCEIASQRKLPSLIHDVPFDVDPESFPYWQTCGCRTREQLEWWFQDTEGKSMLPHLKEHGYDVQQYEVREYAVTDTISGLQVAFDLDCALIVS